MAPDFGPMFRAGTRYSWPNGTNSVIDVRIVGELKLPTGRLVAQDPGWGLHPKVLPFTVPIPCGRYLVTLSISHWDQSPTPRIASPLRLVHAARLVVADRPAASWELALQPGQDPAVLVEGRFFGFGVDSGTGCFMDASAREHLHPLQRRDLWAEVTSAIGEQGGIDISTSDPDLNIVMFKCGMGDGTYPV